MTWKSLKEKSGYQLNINMVYVYDLEQLANLHTATFMSLDKSEVQVFVIHDLRDDRKAYMEFLLQPELRLIGYNCMHYDYQILHRLIMSRDTHRFKRSSSKQLSEWLYSISQDIISGDASPVPEWKYIIPQRDLFKVHHFDNRARSTSLKALEMVMNNQITDSLSITAIFSVARKFGL